ncbi:MAG TPA: RsmE family RNA methyltransferase [Vicinamibacterales bacterium]|jgi:RsmE family RNA methyltransferase|nr:RsmE family RNA methyltransferase [Vicinamibacterales bacterium]
MSATDKIERESAGMNLLLLEPHEVTASGAVRLTGRRAAHLVEVLKVVPGSTVRCGIVNGPRGQGTVLGISDGLVSIDCEFDGSPDASGDRPPLDLLLGLPRPKVMKRLWAQLAALGVGHIVLTNASRVERPYFDTHVLQPDVYRPLLLEGLQQARDTRVPQVSVHRQFRALVEDHLAAMFPSGLRLVADPSSPASPHDVVRTRLGDRSGASATPARCLIAVGPEGGWNAFETTLLNAHGFISVGMGPRTLRSDTACIALLAIVRDALGRS